MKNGILYSLIAVLAWAVFWWSGNQLQDQPRISEEGLLRVRLPVPLQLAYAGSDPYLAANLNVFRSMMVDSTVTEQETYRVQAHLQQDAALFNPYHEDNYYIASAILPWNGFVSETQDILQRASHARTWDWMPPFLYAFDAWYFEKNMQAAGDWAEIAAERSGEVNAKALRAMAAKWYERGDDPQLAKDLIVALQQQTRDADLRAQLQVRIDRLNGLLQLRAAQQAYLAEHQQAPSELEQLLGYAQLSALPEDPMQLGYILDADGVPVLQQPQHPR